ncbi:hypothetical protein [uncultured Dysosmobacter sp.]|uniref:hypothetical protein n=1 Tax=uncultured Dysosmobacter sp. TaxID=2591384 RepID=UPI002638BBFE|nr:hypothetical protein [uncultured Dysosmobacter sp.]
MAKQLNAKIAEMIPDGLITDTQPRPIVRGVTLDGTTPATHKRGTLLTLDAEGGKVKPADSSLAEADPDCILTDDVTITEADSVSGVAVTVYVAGCFDPAKVLDKDGKPIELDAKARNTLRMKGILFKAAVPIETAEN